MRFWFILAFSLLLTANATNGTKSTDGKSFVCNQYNGHNSETNQAIKKIDKKLDQIIEMLQPSPNTGKKFFEQRFVMNLLWNSSRLQEWLTWIQTMKKYLIPQSVSYRMVWKVFFLQITRFISFYFQVPQLQRARESIPRTCKYIRLQTVITKTSRKTNWFQSKSSHR